MCGIAGIFGSLYSAERVERMTRALAHRGPDDEGMEALTDTVGRTAGGLGHRRLSILDLSSAGHQPMSSADGRFRIVFNGEIYNFRALREELQRAGAHFHSGSDTEVILAGWARHGDAFVRRLRGMFAFALWDRATGRGYLVRDPFGIKPLYVAARAGGLLFASEVRALTASGVVSPAIDPAAVHGYLAHGSVPEPLTMLRDVHPVPAGCVVTLQVEDGQVLVDEPRRYVEPLAPLDVEPERDLASGARLVRAALRDSVEHHLVSDVPVALFLSGGVDSSAVVALAAEVSGAPLDTFTVTFHERAYSEAMHARAVATRFGTRHHEVPLAGTDLLAALPAAFAAMDQPSMDGLNTYVVSRAVAREGIKVVLSGLGGDELFAGYPSFRRGARLAPLWAGTAPLRRIGATVAARGGPRGGKLALLLRGDTPARAAYEASRALFAAPLLEALAGRRDDAPHRAPPDGLSVVQQISWYELTGYMRDTLLRDSDVFSMAHHLELRVPFIDPAVARASLSVADALKLAPGTVKPLLVAAVRDLLPPSVWDRPKQGFALPFEHWLRGPLRDEVASALSSPQRLARVGLDAAASRRVWSDFVARRHGMTWSRPWAIYTLVRWAEQTGAGLSAEFPPSRRVAEPAVVVG